MNESNIFGISIRAYIVFIMVTAFVVMSFMKMEVDSTFSTLVVSLISYGDGMCFIYFGDDGKWSYDYLNNFEPLDTIEENK